MIDEGYIKYRCDWHEAPALPDEHVAELARRRGWIDDLERAGVQVIVDTCTYFSPAVRACRGRVMTNSAKWAYYAPGMLGIEVCFGSLRECAESAVRGEVWRDADLWQDIAGASLPTPLSSTNP